MGAGALAAVAAGVTLALATSAVASSTATVSPRDNCGGFNGHVVWSGPSGAFIQLYSEVWDTTCSGTTSVWLSWDSPSYHNVNAETAGEPNTEGVNDKTSLTQLPTNVKVTVCSTNGGWHCGTPVGVPTFATPTSSTTTTAPTTTAPPSPPVVTTPVSVPVPRPSPASRALRVKLVIAWTWNRSRTWLRSVSVGRFPATTRLAVRCEGSGCPRPAVARASGPRRLRGLLHGLRGRGYRAGDRLLLWLQAPSWRPERARIAIRWGHLPLITLL
ncbi:MAG TPA: hypothetical protein VHX62_13055 [Solirubrobacteraceae bacterium]|jgi:hypothetical protein|nr:hypothetical protein [Solirubrobacteraceae bacterium]